MSTAPTYAVGEFAALAGVTIRTLHYYDEIGLLKPSARTGSDHRRYAQADLLRLQQIVTLKYLGFSLSEIETLLNSPAYDLRRSLRLQKEALFERIQQMQQVAFALTRTLDLLEDESPVDWQQMTTIIRAVSAAGKEDLLARYYAPEQQAFLRERAALTPPDMLDHGASQWQHLYAAFREKRHLPTDHPEVQQLAARLDELGRAFTNDDPQIEAALAEMWSAPDELPEAYRELFGDEELLAFMHAALAVYRGG
jgi:DNA-binding transcriptional MerR regulator